MSKNQYRRLFDLRGKTAVVTGGAGILGKRFCAALADHGAAVAVVDLEETEAQNVAAALRSDYGVAAEGFGADVSDPLMVSDLRRSIEAALGPVSILHNNAASKGRDAAQFFEPLESFSLETWQAVMAVNLDGVFLVGREFGSAMAERNGGSIVQTGSIYGVLAPDQRIYEGSEYQGRSINTPPVYSASKAGVHGLTLYLAAYWGRRGVRVNTLTPGGVDSGQNETFRRRYSDRVPMNRMAEADDMTGALVFLASDASRYVTGQNLMIDGGLSAW